MTNSTQSPSELLRHDDYAPGGLLELASRVVTAVTQAHASSDTTKAKLAANILRSWAAEKSAMADALTIENAEYATALASQKEAQPADALEDAADFLRDLAERIFMNCTPAMGFDQGDTDRLAEIATALKAQEKGS